MLSYFHSSPLTLIVLDKEYTFESLDSTTTTTPANGTGVENFAGDEHNDGGELALGLGRGRGLGLGLGLGLG